MISIIDLESAKSMDFQKNTHSSDSEEDNNNTSNENEDLNHSEIKSSILFSHILLFHSKTVL